ncbi:ribonuclease P protein component [Lipingzhangella sp. LS1_29]|uniref:Ribonuclease P protein component n=1 Tax=Lipingzhangella rawalii TaxID=2055835 RepID=A0ABU2H868_9ACTN|nr:ribonuclease P protein component [Lipingzhangella rawalii]MDS1271473.1 ribonuclease P protein component [Lipingzhangella rawalii]
MLPVERRIRRRHDFELTLRHGRRAGRAGLGVALLVPTTSESATPARVGFVVSKAVGNAVVRNRVRRRLRELMRTRIDSLPAGSLLVVRAKPVAATLGYDMLASQLDGALRSARRPRRDGQNPGQGRKRANE